MYLLRKIKLQDTLLRQIYRTVIDAYCQVTKLFSEVPSKLLSFEKKKFKKCKHTHCLPDKCDPCKFFVHRERVPCLPEHSVPELHIHRNRHATYMNGICNYTCGSSDKSYHKKIERPQAL